MGGIISVKQKYTYSPITQIGDNRFSIAIGTETSKYLVGILIDRSVNYVPYSFTQYIEPSDFIINRTPAAKWGDPNDLAGAAIFLSSKASDFVNGHILYVDGGILATIGKPSNED